MAWIQAQRFALLATLLLSFVALPALNANADDDDSDDDRVGICTNELNESLKKVMDAQFKGVLRCIDDFAEGDLRRMTLEACIAGDRGGKVARAERETFRKAKKHCKELPAFGPADPELVNRIGRDVALAVVHEILGPNLDLSIISEDVDDDSADCQEDVANKVRTCLRQTLQAFNRCKKDALRGKHGPPVGSAMELQAACLEDPVSGGIPDRKGKIAEACTEEIAEEIEDECEDERVDLLATFPGCNTGDAGELSRYIGITIRCKVGLALNEVDGLDLDVDRFDDAIANGSCSVCVQDEPCDTGESGVCAAGSINCAHGPISRPTCSPLEAPSVEICDGLDNDCDASTDEELGSTTCGLGLCHHTIENCTDGVPSLCDPFEGAAPEFCDGIDNDCNGSTDDRIPDVITGTDVGLCQIGVQSCRDGGMVVLQERIDPESESCDGLDNDCDGAFDEGIGATTSGISTGICQPAIVSCSGGQFVVVSPGVVPEPESCDLLDNDCDGEVDEGIPTEPRGNNAGQCIPDIIGCVDGSMMVVQPGQGPVAEICNDGLDQDCDGSDCIIAEVSILNPAAASMTAESTIRVEGEAPDGSVVEVLTPLGRFTVGASAFAVEIPLQRNAVNHLFLTATLPDGQKTATRKLTVVQDSQPPSLFIDFPADGAELSTPTVDVAGRVGDVLSGFMGLEVEVNGTPAIVDVGIGTNGTFLAEGIALDPNAPTRITALATDALGNSASQEISVTFVQVPAGVPVILVVAGNGQEAPVGEVLEDPIVVQVLRGDDSPFAEKIVTFRVDRSDGGLLESPGSGEGELSLQVRTDPNGLATAFWRLGSDSGCGNNRVSASSTSVAGSAFFCATALPSGANQINIGTGANQRVESFATPDPLVVWVSDGRNGVPGVPVTFRVIQGDGTLNDIGQEVTVPSSTTGHASVEYTAGPGGGNNIVEADFPGNLSEPASFILFVIERVAGASTSFSGLVVDNAERVIGGARVTLEVNGNVLPPTDTDSQGQFLFIDVPSGSARLAVNGLVATLLAGAPIPAGSFPALSYDTLIVESAANALPTPVILPRLNPANVVLFDNSQDVILTVEEIEGLSMLVRAGSMTLGDGTVPSPGSPVVLALNQVHFDDVPMPMPDGAAPPFAWTLQPSGAHFDPPVEITYPNMSGLPPGSIAYFLSFNHDTGKFEIVSSGSVTDDGAFIVSDPGSGLTVSGWGCNCPPYSVTGEAENCEAKAGGSCTQGCDDGSSVALPNGTVVSESPAGDCTDSVCVDGVSMLQTNDSDAPDDKCKVCENGELKDVELDPTADSSTLSFGMPSETVEKVNDALKKLEKVGIIASVDLLEVSGTLTSRECCEATLGVGKDKSGFVTGNFGSFSVKGKIWPPGPIPTFGPLEIDVFGLASLEAEAKFVGGVFIGLSGSISGKIGYKKNDCSLTAADRDGCMFTNLGTTITPSLSVEIGGSGKVTFDCFFCRKQTIAVSGSLVGGDLSWTIAISSVSFNEASCGAGLAGGTFQPGPGQFKISASFSGSWENEGGTKKTFSRTFDFLTCVISSDRVVCQ